MLFQNPHSRQTIVSILLLMWLGIATTVMSQSVNLPLDHWAYDFLDRLQTRGLIREHRFSIKPFSRREIARMLAEAQDRITDGETIRPPELALLEQLKGEFHHELAELNVQTDERFKERHLLTWDEAEQRFHVDLILDQIVDLRSNQGEGEKSTAVSRSTWGGTLRGQVLKNFGFHLFVKNTLMRGEQFEEERFNPSQGPPIILSGKATYTDDASATMTWQLPWFRIEFGRDRVQWGPGIRGNLTLSSYNPYFSMLKLDFRARGIWFSSLHGKLHSGLDQKFLAAHRLEIRLAPWLVGAWSETVVYGDRPIEPLYLNPLMVYHIAEHHLGDKDNNTMSFDLTAYPFPGHRFYGELFIDDFTLAKHPFKYYGNKFAFLVGWHWIEPLGIQNTDLRLEYAHIEPYVYTHTDSINVYTNYDRTMGHWLGPNSEDFYVRWKALLHRDFSLALISAKTRRGEGDINLPHNESMGEEKRFLSGIVETRWTWGLEVIGQPLRDVFFTFRYHFISTQNALRVSGVNSKDHRFWFHLTMNY